jgi:large subunit ribosomal protein L21
MYAVVKSGGKQYRVSAGDELKVEKLDGNIGDKIIFDKVLLTADGEDIKIGKPYLESSVTGQILYHGKARKVVVFKYKRRKGYRRNRGHRQHFTLVRIENIER